MRTIWIRTIKTALAALLALLAAETLGLEFAAAAAIVAILSVFDTRKATFRGALERLISAVLALSIGTAAFELMGYRPLSFGVYLLVFVPVSFIAKVPIGLGPSSVLVTHLLVKGDVSWSLLVNEMALMFLGTGFALLTNIYAFSERKKLDLLLDTIDQEMMEILNLFARSLMENMEIHGFYTKFSEMDIHIEEAERIAIQEEDNLMGAPKAQSLYRIGLLKEESRILQGMFRDVDSLPPEFVAGGEMAEFMKMTSSQLTQEGAMYEIEKRLRILEDHSASLPLPQSQEEFMNRAHLFQIFRSFQDLVEVKKSFQNAMNFRPFL